MHPKVEKRIIEFSRKVDEAFRFLESEYGYVPEDIELLDFEYPKDRRVVKKYLGKAVGVQIEWRISESSLSVGLYELDQGKFPGRVSFFGGKGYARAINFDLLIKMKHELRMEPPLREMEPFVSFSEMYRKRPLKFAQLLETKMEAVIEILAERLRTYGSDILKGDTSAFPKVQAYSKTFWGIKKGASGDGSHKA